MPGRRVSVAGTLTVPALISPRGVAFGAALALHALFIVLTQRPSGDARMPLAARAMTVRSIALPVDLPVAETVALATPSPPVTVSPAPAEPVIATPEAAPRQMPAATPRETPGLTATATDPALPLAPSRPQAPESQSLSKTQAESQGVVASLPAAPDYLMGARLDPGPRPIGDIEPEYPDSGRMREGTVVLRVLIDEAGHVDNVAVVRATPKGAFEDAAVEAFTKASFSPGRVAGVPVKSQITVEVQFMPINRGARISGRTY